MKKWLKILLWKLIRSVEDKEEEKEKEKIIWSHIVQGIKVRTEEGFTPIAYIHETLPMKPYKVKTSKGYTLEGADDHIVFSSYKPIKLSELRTDMTINTIEGEDNVISVEENGEEKRMCDIAVLSSNESYYTNHILSHNTTSSAIFLLHYALFNTDKNALVLGNKRKTAVEILDKIKKIYLEIPYYLKPGIYKWNEGEIVFDNGCRIMAEATTINSGISFTFHCVLADEFAHIPPTILDKFYNNLFPTITAGKSRFMITSTQNGNNLFARLYNAAVAGENEYRAFKTDWWEVPEWDPEGKRWVKRDEEWHKLQIANYGGEEGFNKQFGTNFDVSANTLISSKKLQAHSRLCKMFEVRELSNIMDSEHFYWEPEYNIEDLKKDFFVITIDISEGVGGDSTVFVFNRIENQEKLRAIGFYKNNSVSVQDCAHILRLFCIQYLTMNRYIVSLEYNLYGELFYKCLKEDNEKNLEDMYKFDEGCVIKYWNEDRTKAIPGKRINSKTKTWAVMDFKQRFEKDMIENYSFQFNNELQFFSDSKGNGTYQASYGHDDIVMAQIHVVFVLRENSFKQLCYYKESVDQVENKPIMNNNGMNPMINSIGGDYIIGDNGFYGGMDMWNMVRGDGLIKMEEDGMRNRLMRNIMRDS